MTGIICLDKPEGITSFLAVKKLTRILGIKKAGHTGTLDPMATGLLVVMLGNCTRFIDFLPETDKSYTARVKLGITTDTLDITGNTLSETDVSISEEEIKKAADAFRGEIRQIPPMYSAIQKDGKRLYDLARQGIEVERESRTVCISELKIYDFKNDEFSMDISCSAGTYVRSLADDIGKSLGCGACLKSLRRTAANGFSIDTALSLDGIQSAVNNGSIENHIMPIDKALDSYPPLTVSDAQGRLFHNGGYLDKKRLSSFNDDGIYRIYDSSRFLGLGLLSEEKLIPRRVFVFE